MATSGYHLFAVFWNGEQMVVGRDHTNKPLESGSGLRFLKNKKTFVLDKFTAMQ